MSERILRRWCSRALLSAALLGVAACMSLQSRFTPLEGQRFAARPASHEIAVLDQIPSSRAFVRVARLDVHVEKTSWRGTSLEQVLPELRRQAQLAGGDAILEIQEQRSRVGETRIYHVTAAAIRYAQ